MGVGMMILVVFCVVALVYVIFNGYAGLVRLAVSLFHLADYAQTLHNSPHERIVDSESMMPVSVVIPECDRDQNIARTVSAVLNSDYPEFEVIAVCEARRESQHKATALSRLKHAFGLVPVRQPIKRCVATKPASQVYRSPQYPNLIVLEKEPAGRHDALNIGVNISRFPLVLTLQPCTSIVEGTLERIAQPFMKSFSVAAVGGLPRIEALMGGLLPNFQQVEYLETFPAGFAVPGQKKLPFIPGAFGAFRKKTIVDEGGFLEGANETGLVVRLYQKRDEDQSAPDVQLLAEPVFQAQPPRGLRELYRQRKGWQKQLLSSLWRNRGMLFNPKYGRNGMLDVPMYWLLDVIGPVVELLGCILVPVAFAIGAISPALFWAFVGAEILLHMVVMLAAVMSQQIIESDAPSTARLMRMLGFALLGSVGYHQLLVLFQVVAMFAPAGDD